MNRIIAATVALMMLALPSAAMPDDPFVNPYVTLHLCMQSGISPDIVIRNCGLVLKNGAGALGTNDRNVLMAVALLHLGNAYVRQGQNDEAAKDFNLSLATIKLRLDKVPGDPWALDFRCFARGVAGTDLEAALSDCDQALKAKPGEVTFLDSRAFVLYRQGNLRGALKGYDAELQTKDGNASALFMRGVVKLRLQDVSGADADVKAAREKQPDIETLYAGYGIKLG